MTAATLADLDQRQRAAVSRALARGKPDAPGTGDEPWHDARRFYQPKFPSTEQLAKVTKGIRSQLGAETWDGHEGPRARMTIAAGALSIGYKNLARREKTIERAVENHARTVDELATAFERDGKFPADPKPRQVIKKWSRKSRNNMRRAFCEIDYGPFFARGEVPAMVTLTYSGAWTVVAPNGRATKRHLHLFRKRFERAWGRVLRCIWKLEFQRRGAPHYHLMMVPPHGKARRGRNAGRKFKQWLSHTWAEIVAHPDPIEFELHLGAGTRIDYADGLKATDPQRVATYFAKHGSFRAKEYQHIVPAEWQTPGDGPGRFWGYMNMRRIVHGVELDHDRATIAARTLRRWARAAGVTNQIAAPRYRNGKLTPAAVVIEGLAGAQEYGVAPRFRSQRRRVKRMGGKFGAGWIASNDGPRLASDLSRYLAMLASPA